MTAIVAVRALDDADAELVALTRANGLRLRRATRPGRSFRVRTVEFDDVPGETTVSAVAAAETFALEVDARSTTAGGAAERLDALIDAVADPTLRTWKLEVTYDTGRVEVWTVLRPADVVPNQVEPNMALAGWISCVVSCRVHPTFTVSEGSS